jgi:hypothetical protein
VNHRTSTRTADIVGWKEDGLAMVQGINTDVPFGGEKTSSDQQLDVSTVLTLWMKL